MTPRLYLRLSGADLVSRESRFSSVSSSGVRKQLSSSTTTSTSELFLRSVSFSCPPVDCVTTRIDDLTSTTSSRTLTSHLGSVFTHVS